MPPKNAGLVNQFSATRRRRRNWTGPIANGSEMTSEKSGFGDFSRQPLGKHGSCTCADLDLLKPLICFIYMPWKLGIDPFSFENAHPQEKVVDGLFMMQRSIPKEKFRMEPLPRKRSGKKLCIPRFSQEWPQSPRKHRKFLVFSYGRIPYWTFGFFFFRHQRNWLGPN